MTSNTAHPRRRLFYFLTLVPLALLSLLSYVGLEGRSQMAAARKIQRLGGDVVFASRFDSAITTASPYGSADWQKWLLNVVAGVDLAFCKSDICDQDLAHLKPLNDLRFLRICNRPITDDALKNVSGLGRLTWLDLHNTQLTDTGLSQLSHLKKLRYLDLSGTQITNIGIESMGLWPQLAHFKLTDTNLTADAINEIGERYPNTTVWFPPQRIQRANSSK